MERNKLIAEMKSLEQENHSLADQLKDLNHKLFEKKKEAKKLFENSDESKKSLVRFISEENDLQHEIKFLKSEKSKLIDIYGNVGMHVGEKMAGGKILVRGDAAGWAGSDMKGGSIEILGNAADYLASPYRGSSGGMSKGKIIVHGNVGSDVAVFMKGGVIKIHGNAGPFLGFRMRGGTIHVEKNVGRRVAACMTGGKIVVSGILEDIPPTFTIDAIKPKTKIEEGYKASGPFYVFLGDRAEEGKGKLFVSKENNPKLNSYEKFL